MMSYASVVPPQLLVAGATVNKRDTIDGGAA